MSLKKTFNDPYEYAVGRFERDHELWLELFQIIDKLYGEKSKIFSKLYAFRIAGTAIKESGNMYVLRPIIDSSGNFAWKSIEEYMEFRDRHLVQFTEEITTILSKLTEYQDWKNLYKYSLGKTVITPAGDGILEVFSPYGAQVKIGQETKTFEFDECKPF